MDLLVVSEHAAIRVVIQGQNAGVLNDTFVVDLRRVDAGVAQVSVKIIYLIQVKRALLITHYIKQESLLPWPVR